MRPATKKPCHVEPLEKPVDEQALADAHVFMLLVAGMGCPACATRVHNGLLRMPTVLRADVDLHQELATVYARRGTAVEELVGAVRRAGEASGHAYHAVPAASVQRSSP